MRRFCYAAVLSLVCYGSRAQPADEELAHTYSIVARDAGTGQFGVAVQTHWFAVGRRVPWASAGVGAVATQSSTNPSFGPRGLALLREGKSASEALEMLIASDEGRALRQVAIVDSQGRVAAWTGDLCIPAAGHQTGDGYSVQANLMLSDEVWPAMAAAFESATGSLAARMMTTLEAAQATGGDIRGRQSAAMIVVRPDEQEGVWAERIVDLRVDDHPAPLSEMRRLLSVSEAYEHLSRGSAALGEGDLRTALSEYAEATRAYPGNPEIRFWQAVRLTNHGHLEYALPVFQRVFEEEGAWRTLVARLPSVDRLEVTQSELERIIALGSE
jgi:uncharacterized Ntn-hydrolase superfamily protein